MTVTRVEIIESRKSLTPFQFDELKRLKTKDPKKYAMARFKLQIDLRNSMEKVVHSEFKIFEHENKVNGPVRMIREIWSEIEYFTKDTKFPLAPTIVYIYRIYVEYQRVF